MLSSFLIFAPEVLTNSPASASQISRSALASTTALPFDSFTRVGALTLKSGENWVASSVIDPIQGFAYFGTSASPGIIVKVRLSDFVEMGSLTLNPGEDGLGSAVIDQG